MHEFDDNLKDVLRLLNDIRDQSILSNFYLKNFFARQLEIERKEKVCTDAIIKLSREVDAISET